MKGANIIECMSRFDGSDLDGRLLQLLLAVLETGSITAAAARLGVTQSAVSHLLDKLRAITGDPLFVKRGRGIVPTAHAEGLAAPARELLRQMGQFAQGAAFDPARWHADLTIAANDFQRDLLPPPLAARLRGAASRRRSTMPSAGPPPPGAAGAATRIPWSLAATRWVAESRSSGYRRACTASTR